jgi:hypothetical protein
MGLAKTSPSISLNLNREKKVKIMGIKSACAYKIKGNIFLQGYAETTDGLGLLDGPVFVIDEHDVLQLGKNIAEAIRNSGSVIPHPTQEQWKEMDKKDPLLKAAKMKTWNAMMKVAKVVEIKEKEKNIEFLPLRFRGATGPNRGYDFLYDKAIICTDFSPEILGRALLQAFDLCE